MKWVVITLLVLTGFLSGMVFYLLGQVQDVKASLILTPETMGAQKTQESVDNKDYEPLPEQGAPAIPDADSLAPDSQTTNNYSDRYQGDKIEGEEIPAIKIYNPSPI